jgi:hypothetical protein
MPSDSGNDSTRGLQKRPFKSNQLESTLKELEGAFADWDSLNANSAGKPTHGANSTKKRSGTPGAEKGDGDDEARKRTRKILNQLRDQLDKLND